MIYPSTAELFRLFGGAFLLGLVFGLFYDAMRITRVLMGVSYGAVSNLSLPMPVFSRQIPILGKKVRNVLINLEDFAFFLIAAPATAIYISAANNGQFRWLVLAGIGGAFILYRLTIAKLVIAVSETLARLLRFLLAWAFWILLFPLRKLASGLAFLWKRFAKQVVSYIYLPLYTKRAMRHCLRDVKHTFDFAKRRDVQ